MARFCTKCGNSLAEGERCSCQVSGGGHVVANGKRFLLKLMHRMGVGAVSENAKNAFEDGQQVIPDIIKSNDGELPVKQYDAAFMRSRIRGQYAKGKLQVTNKRVIFRAAGVSYQGPIAQQYEFAINEIAGIEVKKKNRISAMNVLLSLLLNAIVSLVVAGIFSSFADKTPTFALLCSIVLALASAIPFFVVYKKFWIKLISLCCGIGALSGTAGITNLSASALYFGLKTNIADYLLGAMFLLWFINVVLVSLVPDLVLIIKTKGTAPAFEIRRKLFPTPFRPMAEYTDFSEVLPGKDVDLMITELGALIDDIQTIGDEAIDEWKEK